MPSLKDLRGRIRSVKSTQKITSAMKMVAASKLRRAQEQAEASRPYAQRLERLITALGAKAGANAPQLLTGNGPDKIQLVIVATSDRGLCGAFNASIVREVKAAVRDGEAQGKKTLLLHYGSKGRDALRKEFASAQLGLIEPHNRKRLSFVDAEALANKVMGMFEKGEINSAHIVYARFKSAISQIVTRQQIIPAPIPADAGGSDALYDYEPSEEAILEQLLPRNLAVQIYRALLENAASEHGSRMTAMDNATRNAGDMINRLTLNYNRTRQAFITKELIEIISGAEAV